MGRLGFPHTGQTDAAELAEWANVQAATANANCCMPLMWEKRHVIGTTRPASGEVQQPSPHCKMSVSSVVHCVVNAPLRK